MPEKDPTAEPTVPAVEPGPEEGVTETPVPSAPAEDWATRYKYLLADFDNFRKRVERDRESITRQARARLLQELLPIYEAFHFAREAVDRLPADDPLKTGLDLLQREWQRFLKHEGVEAVATPGEPFQSELHEAVGELPPTAERPPGVIAEVVQQGYRFYGGLLRPAKVIVTAAPRAEDATSAAEPGPPGNH
jgi:molecular chaperone GrpE